MLTIFNGKLTMLEQELDAMQNYSLPIIHLNVQYKNYLITITHYHNVPKESILKYLITHNALVCVL